MSIATFDRTPMPRIAMPSDFEAKHPQPSLRPLLDELARQDAKDNTSKLRELAETIKEVADEHGIAQPGPNPTVQGATGVILSGENFPKFEFTVISPLTQLASTLKSFTFSEMMRLTKDLKTIEHANFETAEGIADLLDKWADKQLTSVDQTHNATSAK